MAKENQPGLHDSPQQAKGRTLTDKDLDIVEAEVIEPEAEVTEPEVETPDVPSLESYDEPAPKRSGGFVPMLLGGVIAGGIGYGAATYLPDYLNPPAEVAQQEDPFAPILAAQAQSETSLAALEAKLEDIAARPQAPDLTEGLVSVTAGLANLQATLTDVQSQQAQLADRMVLLEKRPVTAALAPEAIAAYERDIETLRQAMAAQRAEIEAVAANAAAQIEAAQVEAARVTAATQATAQNGIAQAALQRVMAAIESGAPFATGLAELSSSAGLDIPTDLQAIAQNGVPTQSALQEAFPDAARAALDVARRVEGPAEGESAVGAFFKSQLGVRSLTPQDGDDADAVLSRAEAAVRQGDLVLAQSEIQSLPSAAQEVLAPWLTQLSQRQTAKSQAQSLADALAQN